MRSARVWKRLIGVDDRTVIEDIEFSDNDEAMAVVGRWEEPDGAIATSDVYLREPASSRLGWAAR